MEQTLTHKFRRGQPIDCSQWICFEKVKEDGRFVWYRFTVVKAQSVDSFGKVGLELPTSPMR